MDNSISKKALVIGLLALCCIFLGVLYVYTAPFSIPTKVDIQSMAKYMIRNRPDPGALTTSMECYFKAGTSLTTSELVGDTGLTPEQICLHKGDLKDNEALEVGQGTIRNNGTTELTVKISIMCHRAQDLEGTLKDIGLEDIELKSEYGTCDCDLSSTQMCCVVILRQV